MMNTIWMIVQYVLGFIVGWFFPVIDRRMSVYLMEKEHIRPVHRSFMFLFAVIAMAVFQVSSSRSLAGFGALLGIQVAILWEMRNVWHNEALLRQNFFWDLAKDAKYETLRWFCLVFVAVTIAVLLRSLYVLTAG